MDDNLDIRGPATILRAGGARWAMSGAEWSADVKSGRPAKRQALAGTEYRSGKHRICAGWNDVQMQSTGQLQLIHPAHVTKRCMKVL